MAEKSTMFEEREAFMVSPTGGIPTLRNAHFLRPISESISGPDLKLPSVSPTSKWPIKVAFNGWRSPQKKWSSWVALMSSRYESVWQRAGIYKAIMASTFRIKRNPELIFRLGERWCPETNTFIFPFGEATITLEEMMVLGGYSVLGFSVSLALETSELLAIEEILINLSLQLGRSPARSATHGAWLNHFMQSGSEVQHEAFLALWLSRFVFPRSPLTTINKNVFPIAIHLARGTRIAIAPAVLASLYRDLGLLKKTIVASGELDPDCGKDSYLTLTLWAPWLFVQVWGWERIPQLQPKPNYIDSGELRLARWHKVKSTEMENVQSVIDSAGESFLWRPYAMAVDKWDFPRFYKENETWVSNTLSDLDDELESYFYCLRVCELFSLACTEPYFPNRVAMQFGIDQDLPVWFPRTMKTPETVWNNYVSPISDTKLYLPCRQFESDVTTRYLEWWRTVVSYPPDKVLVPVTKKKRSSRTLKRLQQITEVTNDGAYVSPPPGFPPNNRKLNDAVRSTDNGYEAANKLNDHKGQAESHVNLCPTEVNGDAKEMKSWEKLEEMSVQCQDAIENSKLAVKQCHVQIKSEDSMETMFRNSKNGHERGSLVMAGSQNGNDTSPPPGFLTNHRKLDGEGGSCQNEDETDKMLNGHGSSSSPADNGDGKGMDSLEKQEEKTVQSKGSTGSSKMTLEPGDIHIKSKDTTKKMVAMGVDGHERGSLVMAGLDIFKLEARVGRLERVMSAIKTMRSGQK